MQPVDCYTVNALGYVAETDAGKCLTFLPQYSPALKGLSEFSHCQVLWWLHEFSGDMYRRTTRTTPPYEAPECGVFATRSPVRPNPIGLSVVSILSVDEASGVICVDGLDAYPGTPVLDIKAYFPSTDRVQEVRIPEYARGWGEWVSFAPRE